MDKGDITRAYWKRKFIWYDVLWCQCLRTKGYKKGDPHIKCDYFLGENIILVHILGYF